MKQPAREAPFSREDTDFQGGKQIKGTARNIHSPWESGEKKNGRLIFLPEHVFKLSKYLNAAS